MKPSMICGAVLAILVGSACSAQSARARRPTPGDSVVAGPPMSAAEVAAVQSGGTAVDTIMVSPDHVDLKVGQSVMPFAALSLRAVDAKGEVVNSFRPAFIWHKSSVFVRDGLMIRGAKAGVDSFYVEALPRTTSARTRPSTAVRVLVHP